MFKVKKKPVVEVKAVAKPGESRSFGFSVKTKPKGGSSASDVKDLKEAQKVKTEEEAMNYAAMEAEDQEEADAATFLLQVSTSSSRNTPSRSATYVVGH